MGRFMGYITVHTQPQNRPIPDNGRTSFLSTISSPHRLSPAQGLDPMPHIVFAMRGRGAYCQPDEVAEIAPPPTTTTTHPPDIERLELGPGPGCASS